MINMKSEAVRSTSTVAPIAKSLRVLTNNPKFLTNTHATNKQARSIKFFLLMAAIITTCFAF